MNLNQIYVNQILTAVRILTPYLKKIAEEKIIPFLKKRYYENVNKAVAKMLLRLAELGEKAINCEDTEKKARHKIGFKLGYEFVCTLEVLVNEAKKTLSVINDRLEDGESNV